MSIKDILYIALLLPALLLFGVGCQKLTPAQQAERAFIRAFEKDYPDWEVTKIILSPCNGVNMYRGPFDCTARDNTRKCWMTIIQKPAKDSNDLWAMVQKKLDNPRPLDNGRVPCYDIHAKGDTISWSVLVTSAHGDCYYELAKDSIEYD